MSYDNPNAIQLEVVTPKGRALRVSVDEVTAPGAQGEFGVLPGHNPLLAALRTGIVSYRQGSEQTKCAVGVGFAEVGPSKLVILTDEYIERAQVDVLQVRKDLAELQSELKQLSARAHEAGSPEAAALVPLIDRENWLAAQLELYGDAPPAVMRPFENFGPPDPPRDEEIPEDTTAPSA